MPCLRPISNGHARELRLRKTNRQGPYLSKHAVVLVGRFRGECQQAQSMHEDSLYRATHDDSVWNNRTPPTSNPLEQWRRLGTDWLGVICELEGVLVSDATSYHEAAWRALALEENFQYPVEYEMRHKYSLKAEQLISQVFNWTHNKVEIKRLASRKQEIFVQQLKRDKVTYKIQPGVLRLINLLQVNDIPCVLLSQDTRSNIQYLLKDSTLHEYMFPNATTGVGQERSEIFLPLIAADDVRFGLPDTEGIALGAFMLKRPLNRLVVLGSSLQALEAAYELNTHTIMVSSKHKLWELKRADLVVSSLEEISVQNFKNLLHEI